MDGNLVIGIGIFIFLCVFSFVLIKVIPEIKIWLKKEKTIQNNYNTTIPGYLPPQQREESANISEEKREETKKKEEEKAEEDMNRIFEVPDLDNKMETNFDKLGKEKKKEN